MEPLGTFPHNKVPVSGPGAPLKVAFTTRVLQLLPRTKASGEVWEAASGGCKTAAGPEMGPETGPETPPSSLLYLGASKQNMGPLRQGLSVLKSWLPN